MDMFQFVKLNDLYNGRTARNSLIIGKRCSGKSSLVKNITDTLQFDCTIVVNKYSQSQLQTIIDTPHTNTLIVFEDCCVESIVNDDVFKYLLMNGRHYNISTIIVMQYPFGLTPTMRSTIDFVYYFNSVPNNKQMYNKYFGMFPTFKQFDDVMQLLNAYECIVLNNVTASLDISDFVNIANVKGLWPNFCENNNDVAVEFLLRPKNRYKIWWELFSQNNNSKAVEFLLRPENQDKIHPMFSANNNDLAVEFLLQPENRNKLWWEHFSENNNDMAVDFLLLQNINKIDWRVFSQNNNDLAVGFLLRPENRNKISWSMFNKNNNDLAVEFLLQNQNKIQWNVFSENNNDLAVEFLLRPENIDKIQWEAFSTNNNDLAVEFLLRPENIDKIRWEAFSKNNNSKAVEFLLLQNRDKIHWPYFISNNNIFEPQLDITNKIGYYTHSV